MKNIILLFLFLISTFLIKAQTNGLVIDQENLPIESANVLLW